jgi:hypothetical protein
MTAFIVYFDALIANTAVHFRGGIHFNYTVSKKVSG